MQQQMTGQTFVEQLLSNSIALEQAIQEAERMLSGEVRRPDLQQELGMFERQDDKHLQNFRSALNHIGGQDRGPDEATRVFIDTSRQILRSNVPVFDKLGTYMVMKDKARTADMLLAHIGQMQGDERLEQIMAVNEHEDEIQELSLKTQMGEMAAELAKGQQPGGGTRMGMAA